MDLLRLGMIGPRTRKLRTALSGLGISVGIAAAVAVTGISDSDQQHLPARLDQLGSELGTAAPVGRPAVAVSRPSDLLPARSGTENDLTPLVLVLAGVAVLVGGIGISSTMVVGVMERRGEIGLRRALGARSGQISAQFLLEAVLVGFIGGTGGLLLGSLTVYGYALVQGRPAVIPFRILIAGPPVSVVVGALAGLHPALRAARTSPTEALRPA
ncbi:ABC transporter permease [Streptomyces sp. NPDC056883]|uniref:ABC transporter permease n=1 Tax=Streptomyces sp. NPDC056883 TaxID=3345959 RepID=UPI0036931A30